jgi:uncharacterized protein
MPVAWHISCRLGLASGNNAGYPGRLAYRKGIVRGGLTVAREDRGFASMNPAKQREIASKGGKAAHQKGSAHEWTSEEAREAGRKGGMASHRRKQGDSHQSSSAAKGSGESERVR